MRATSVIRSLGPIDAKSVGRDSLLRWTLLMPIAIALLIRWGLPWLAGRLLGFGFDLTAYYPAIVGYGVVLLTPYMVGFVVGFLLLDQRDDGTLTALQVTPLSLAGYLAYRLSVPVVVSLVMTALMFPIMGLVHLDVGTLALALLAAAPQAALVSLYLAGFARNKVEGFALMKASSIIVILPLAAYFVQMPWQWLFGLLPTYWPAKAFWMMLAGDGMFWLPLAVGLAYQAALLAALVRRFYASLHTA